MGRTRRGVEVTVNRYPGVAAMAKKRDKGPKYASFTAWLKAQPKDRQASLRETLDDLGRLFAHQKWKDYHWWHRVGTRVGRLLPKADRQYGANVMSLLAGTLQPGDAREVEHLRKLLYYTRELADYYSQDEASELTKRVQSKDTRFRAHHVRLLLSVDDKQQRKWLERQCLKEGWSGGRLHQEIQNRIGYPRSRSGRLPELGPPPPLRVALDQLIWMAKQWMARHQQHWRAEKNASLGKVAAKDCKPRLREQVTEALKQLTDVATAVKEEHRAMGRLAKEVERNLALAQARSRSAGTSQGNPRAVRRRAIPGSVQQTSPEALNRMQSRTQRRSRSTAGGRGKRTVSRSAAAR